MPHSVRCTAFSSLFELLGGLCGLRTQTLKGYAKGLGYEPGMSFEDAGLERHAWNAVLVAGQWRLVDAMWGSLCALLLYTLYSYAASRAIGVICQYTLQ